MIDNYPRQLVITFESKTQTTPAPDLKAAEERVIKPRPCFRCDKKFSYWAIHRRICDKCKNSRLWMSGLDTHKAHFGLNNFPSVKRKPS